MVINYDFKFKFKIMFDKYSFKDKYVNLIT